MKKRRKKKKPQRPYKGCQFEYHTRMCAREPTQAISIWRDGPRPKTYDLCQEHADAAVHAKLGFVAAVQRDSDE